MPEPSSEPPTSVEPPRKPSASTTRPHPGTLARSASPKRIARRLRTPSRVIGLYQTFFRRNIEHFFPNILLEAVDNLSFIDGLNPLDCPNYHFEDEPDKLGILIRWFKTRYRLMPSRPVPFLASERSLIATIARSLDTRFRTVYDQAAQGERLEMFHYTNEDYIVADHLNPEDPLRICAALEALRVATLSTYENRRVSTGTLLLGTQVDPADPTRTKMPGAPRYSVRLSAVKSFHRICDGLRTVFVVDREGDLNWVTDIRSWAEHVQGTAPLDLPCPRDYTCHAKATQADGHICLVLTPNQEIKVFARGVPIFAFSDARWRLLSIPEKYQVWDEAVGPTQPPHLASRLFQAALNLAEARDGALFVVLRDPDSSLPQLVDRSDWIIQDADLAESPHDPEPEAEPETISPYVAKRALHHLVRGRGVTDLDETVLESLSGIDGAVVVDTHGRLLSFGAILRIPPDTPLAGRSVEGARTTAALAASFHGPVLKVSQDGFLTMFLKGRRIWEL